MHPSSETAPASGLMLSDAWTHGVYPQARMVAQRI